MRTNAILPFGVATIALASLHVSRAVEDANNFGVRFSAAWLFDGLYIWIWSS